MSGMVFHCIVQMHLTAVLMYVRMYACVLPDEQIYMLPGQQLL